MKNLFILFLALLSYGTATAQETLSEGSLVFEISNIKSDNPNLQQAMKGSTNQVHFKGTSMKNDIQMMNGAVRMQYLSNSSTRESYVYIDLMGKQTKVSMPDSVQKVKEKELVGNTNITYDEASTKTIQGYKCHKAIAEILLPNGSVKAYHLYLTEAITVPASAISGLPSNLKGFPLEFTIVAGETEMAYTLKSFSKTMVADALKMPDTYPTMDYKEFEKSMGKRMGL
jgi:hypothetical protein